LRSFLVDVYRTWSTANLRTGDAPVIRITGRFPELLDRKLADLTPWLIEKWRPRRKGDGIDAVTLNRDLDDLKAALARAADWGLVDVNPIAGVKRAKVDRAAPIRFLTDDEEQRLRAALETPARSVFGASGTAPMPGATNAATLSCRISVRPLSPIT
jgi:hypothetical protein